MRIRTAVRVLTAVLVAATGLSVLTAVPAAAAPPGSCTLRMVSLTALNLYDDGGTDLVWLKLDQTFFPPGNEGVAFQTPDLGDARPAADFGAPVMGFTAAGLTSAIVFDRFPFNYVLDGAKIPCAATDHGVRDYKGGGAVYRLRYTVA